LDRAEDALVSLDEELELVMQYVSIEEVRFADRLRVEVDVSPDARLAAVPNLFLQPLVENAVRHGVGAKRAPGVISISGRRVDGVLQLVVRDTGPGLPDDPTGALASGVGLSNTRRRLETLYGDSHRFQLENHRNGGLEVRIEIPYEVFQPHTGADEQTAMARREIAARPVGGDS
jgi:LytS/YehU family sensor histidine kinase